MIEFKDVSFSYGENKIIDNLSFSLESGKNLMITGPSGCGKTTVLKLILGLLTPQSGEITAPDYISAVFQEDRLIEKLNIYKNICLPLNKKQIGFADKLISEFGFDDLKNKPIKSLSGGMKRRVAILRAIAFGGEALILDEPFNGIDEGNIKLIADIINREYTDKGKSVIIISHNKDDAKLFNADILEINEPKS